MTNDMDWIESINGMTIDLKNVNLVHILYNIVLFVHTVNIA
jgi:hypothetical protein